MSSSMSEKDITQHNFDVLQREQDATQSLFRRFDAGKISEQQFCQALTELGLKLTGSFHSQLRSGSLTRATLFRALLRPTMVESRNDRVAGCAVEYDPVSEDSAFAKTEYESAEQLAEARNHQQTSNQREFQHERAKQIDPAKKAAIAAAAAYEFEQYPNAGGEIPIEIQDALKVFVEEQVDGARLRRYLYHECGLDLSDDQVNLINRQEVSGRRNLKALLMSFAPQRRLRPGFARADAETSLERQKALAALAQAQSPTNPERPMRSYHEIADTSRNGTTHDMLVFEPNREPPQERRMRRAGSNIPASTRDFVTWSDLDPEDSQAVAAAARPQNYGVRANYDSLSAQDHGDIFTWQSLNEKIPKERPNSKAMLPERSSVQSHIDSTLLPHESMDLRSEFGAKKLIQSESVLRSEHSGARALLVRNEYPRPQTADFSSSTRSHLEPTAEEFKRCRRVGIKPASQVIQPDVHSFAFKPFPQDTAKLLSSAAASSSGGLHSIPMSSGGRPVTASQSARPSTAHYAPFGTDANVDSPVVANVTKPRGGEMTPQRIYEALNSSMRRLAV